MATTSQYYICNNCDFKTTLLSRTVDHLQVHIDTKKLSRFSFFNCFDRLKPLKCTSCDFTTESSLFLKNHLAHNHDQRQFSLKAKLKICKKCGFHTQSNYLWIRHRIFGTCKNKKGSTKKDRERVSMKKSGKMYLCGKCDYRTIYSDTLKDHVIYKHTPLEEIDWQQCKECPAKFKTLKTLIQHQKNVHLSAADHLHCSECNYSTPSRYHLARHFNTKHAQPEEIEWMECQECGAKFKDKEQLKKHLKIHTTEEKRYKCDQCSFKTHRQDAIKVHIGRFHDDSALKCDFCDYRAKYKNAMQTHKKNKHSIGDVKWLNCEHCDYSTRYKGNLKQHILAKHNKDGKVFQCKECDYNTHSKRYLAQHMNRVHKRRNVTITCENCTFVAAQEEELQGHMFNRHPEVEKLRCPHCTYFCFIKRHLIQHLESKHKIGDKIRWYECNKCDYKNRDKRCLVGHMYNVHDEGKLLECDRCIYKTGSLCAMRKHKTTHKSNKWIPDSQ